MEITLKKQKSKGHFDTIAEATQFKRNEANQMLKNVNIQQMKDLLAKK
ncbi:hypothetical protein LV89_04858 [Arcicella aurantiaca]|uniref:Uncharacterized protein n=1 Tax=Arcicella aurantiaca TaxID=591202 RepID=A0A316DGJ6_9BACT|nr:hypothetical protein [Arcicella aurantiaca]PWK16642.1 hypothetical protein LV89_04858 [Arcicella aurantiaca]